MSAFIVADETINKAVGWIYSHCQHDRYPNYGWYVKRRLREAGYNPETKLGCKRLAEEMFTLNCDAVEQRYGEGEAEKFRPLDFAFSLSLMNLTAVAWIKLVECWLYQCAEGDAPENVLYEAMSALVGDVAKCYISTLPEYDKAAWGH